MEERKKDSRKAKHNLVDVLTSLEKFRSISKKGLSLCMDTNYMNIIDKKNFSANQLKKASQYAANGAEICRKQKRENDAETYSLLSDYFHDASASKRARE